MPRFSLLSRNQVSRVVYSQGVPALSRVSQLDSSQDVLKYSGSARVGSGRGQEGFRYLSIYRRLHPAS